MNTNQLESFAKAARIKLLDQVGRKLDFVLTQDSAELRGKQNEINQLKQQIAIKGKEQVIETVAYTWFNRLMALRFMDANGYNIPKVLTPLPNMTQPEIMQNALAGHLEADLKLDRQRLNDLLDGRTAAVDAHDEVYKMLLIAVCNQLNKAMPFMFEYISDYTELLLPDKLLSEFSIVTDIRNGMSAEDCQYEEILGWLYQFYVADENERLIKSKKAYAKHELAPASQLFTPKWIVKYMVDNTLGQLWSEINPKTTILDKLEFYINPAYKEQLQPRAKKALEEIKFFEPCVGSAHILSYAFDVFYLMYEEQGYNASEVPELILKHNLFGIDIDERAAQIASFVLMMKGRRKNSRFLRKSIVPNIAFYQDFGDDAKFNNAKAIGSLIKVEPKEIDLIKVEESSVFAVKQKELKKLYTYLGQRYDCVVTNPPYISSSRMEGTLKQFVEANYPDTKSDLFATFVLRCLELCNEDGLTGYMTPFVWMFISSYEKLRKVIIDKHFINNLIQLEYSGFDGATVPICTFTLRNKLILNAKASYVRLSDFKGSENQAPRTLEAIKNKDCGWFYQAEQKEFIKIPSCPIGYWVSLFEINLYLKNNLLSNYSHPAKGIDTGENSHFLRFWHEIAHVGFDNKLGAGCWVPYNKGGEFRRWYGNKDYVLRWNGSDDELRSRLTWAKKKPTLRNRNHWFKEGFSWTTISSGGFSIRYTEDGALFDNGGCTLFANSSLFLFGGLLNSKIADRYLDFLSPTLNFQPGSIGFIAINENVFNFEDDVTKVVLECITISKTDWNSRETSWDFKQNELVKQKTSLVRTSFDAYDNYWKDKFYELHRNEVELNRQFIEIYGLQDELTPDVPLQEITILQEEAKIVDNKLEIQVVPVLLQLISYAVGCMFGRYSLDKPGLILANQGETLDDYLAQVPNPSFAPDEDNVLPVLEDEWFTDDIVGRFKSFLKTAFGTEHFEENLGFIEEALGKDIRKYLVKDFYNDHVKRYKKRPIYWQFSSPKGHFKALIYMHRYKPDLCSRILNNYLQAFISKLEAAKQTQTMLSIREDLTSREKKLAIQEIDKLSLMLKDCNDYELRLRSIATQKIVIDLDDGVKVNYQKFKEVLLPIKGLEKEEE